jgi:hypothetical protein
MRRRPLRILASAGSDTRICTRISSPTVAGRRGAALAAPPPLPGLPPLDEAEDLSPSAFFILLAAAEVSERWSDGEELLAEDAEETEAAGDAGPAWGM